LSAKEEPVKQPLSVDPEAADEEDEETECLSADLMVTGRFPRGE